MPPSYLWKANTADKYTVYGSVAACPHGQQAFYGSQLRCCVAPLLLPACAGGLAGCKAGRRCLHGGAPLADAAAQDGCEPRGIASVDTRIQQAMWRAPKLLGRHLPGSRGAAAPAPAAAGLPASSPAAAHRGEAGPAL